MFSQKLRLLTAPIDVISKAIPDIRDLFFRSIIIVGLLAVVFVTIKGQLFQPLLKSYSVSDWTRFIIRPSMLWIIMGYVFLLFRTLLWFRYRPFQAADPEEAPSLTVVIPAYNEGSMVEKSIDSAAAAMYPSNRLEIVVVDDGSKDDTWYYIQKAARRYPGLVTAVQFKKNQGKRAALAAAFRAARGEIVATIDSDSVIERGALLALVGPFRDPDVGAVAGKVAAYNRNKGLISKMLHVRFILSFDFLRAVQSTYKTVYCCPGALSAYRTSVVRAVLDAWLNQTFLGEPCTYGEDRALTNYIFSRGYGSVYQRTAVVHTIVPETYEKLCKMYLRWDRSYIKEEIRFARILWKRPPVSRALSLIDSFTTNLRYPVSYAAFFLFLYMSAHDPMTIVRLLFAMGFISFLNMLYYLRSEQSWDFVYGIFYSYFAFFTLFWIFPYAVVTVRSRSWMTR